MYIYIYIYIYIYTYIYRYIHVYYTGGMVRQSLPSSQQFSHSPPPLSLPLPHQIFIPFPPKVNSTQ